MRKWTAPETSPQDVAVLLVPRFSNHCLANAIEPLRAANDLLMRQAYRWTFVTLDGGDVVSSSGLPVRANGRLRDHPGGDMLFVMSSHDAALHANATTTRSLLAAKRRFNHIVGLDTGAWLMAQAGFLDGRPATIHWDELTAFSEAYPLVDAVADRYVMDGDMITCGGAMAAFDLIVALIEEHHGAAIAMEVRAYFLHQSAQAPQRPYINRKTSPLVEGAIAIMSGHLETPLPIADIAARMASTQKTLSRAFTAELGAPPMTVYKRLRLNAARRYAQDTLYSIAEIALRCGYQNVAAMTRAFTAEFGRPPRSFR